MKAKTKIIVSVTLTALLFALTPAANAALFGKKKADDAPAATDGAQPADPKADAKAKAAADKAAAKEKAAADKAAAKAKADADKAAKKAAKDAEKADTAERGFKSTGDAALDAQVTQLIASAPKATPYPKVNNKLVDPILVALTNGQQHFNNASALIKTAIGKKDEAKSGVDQAVTDITNAGIGATAGERTESAQQEIDDMMKNAAAPTEEGKKIFSVGAAEYRKGAAALGTEAAAVVAASVTLKTLVANAQKLPIGANLAVSKLQPAVDIINVLVNDLPPKVTAATATGASIVKYAATHGITIDDVKDKVNAETKAAGNN